MTTGADKETRQKQKEFLKTVFPDYDARHHDYFVDEYNRKLDKEQLATYHKLRGFKEREENETDPNHNPPA